MAYIHTQFPSKIFILRHNIFQIVSIYLLAFVHVYIDPVQADLWDGEVPSNLREFLCFLELIVMVVLKVCSDNEEG